MTHEMTRFRTIEVGWSRYLGTRSVLCAVRTARTRQQATGTPQPQPRTAHTARTSLSRVPAAARAVWRCPAARGAGLARLALRRPKQQSKTE